MAEEEARAHIEARKHQHATWCRVAYKLGELKDEGLRPEVYHEVMAKVSSKMAMCEISIRDHEKLLK